MGRVVFGLKELYGLVSALTVMMVLWIFVTPSTLYLGFTAPPQVPTAHPINKYRGHLSVVLLHQFPAGIWSLLVPVQLFTPLRKSFPTIHRICGYVFFATVPLITAGVFLIFHRKLDFEFGPSELGLSPFTNSGYFLKVFISILGIYFLLTAMIALKRAREKSYDDHFKWVVRHLASGIWVAPLRIYSSLRRPTTLLQAKSAFYDGTLMSIVLTLTAGELFLLYYNQSPTRKVANKKN